MADLGGESGGSAEEAAALSEPGLAPAAALEESAERGSPRALRRGLALILVPSLALAGIEVYSAARIVPELRQSQALVTHAFEIIAAASALDHAIQGAERGQRGFLITGDDSYLNTYRVGAQQAPLRLAELRQLTADSPEQQHRAVHLEIEVAAKLDELKRTIAIRQKDGFDAARQIVQTNLGRDVMDTITTEIRSMIAAENSLLGARQRQFLAAQRIVTAFSLAAAALTLMVILLGGTLLARAYRRILRSQASLRRSEERFRLLVSGVRDYAMFMLDPAGHVASWNEGAERLEGYRADEILGSHISRFYPAGETGAGEPDRMLETAVAEGHAEAEGWRIRKDGSRLWASVAVTALRDAAGRLRGFAKIVHDITERREAELALEENQAMVAQLQKMEALGQLTGGVAHDFNNNLTAILGNVELLQHGSAAADGGRTARLLAAVQRAAEQAAELTRRLLAFSRRQALAPQMVDVNKLVGSMSALLHRTLGEGIVTETVLAAGLWPAEIDPNQLENAVLNLAVNARDAMPGGGKLTIETGNAYLDDHYATTRTEVKSGQYVMIAVTDSGEGMSREIRARAFEPFFTTKPEGHGTGLGLSQVHGFVKQSGGHIELYSELGEGTTIKIYLPRAAAVGAPATAAPPEIAATPRSETVLIVEDNDDVRVYGAEALTSLGYRVLEAAEAGAALRLVDMHPEIALLFTDVGLPGVNGRQLAEEAKSRRPGLRVLYTTGYARNAIVHNGILDAEVDLLAKPFTTEALARKLQQMLRGG